MKKLLLIIVLILTYNLHTANCVPVIANVSSEEAKKAIFTVITTYSFESMLNPENFGKLSPEDKEAITEDALTFLTGAIKKEHPLVEVLPIPKSLYELLVYWFMLKQKQEALERISPKYLAKQVTDRKKIERDLQTCACGITRAKRGDSGVGFLATQYPKNWVTGNYMEEFLPDIDLEINDYYENPHVQTVFWAINEEILSVLEKNKIHSIDKIALKTLTDTVIDDIDDILTRESISYTEFEEWRKNFNPEKPEDKIYAETAERFLDLIKVGNYLPKSIAPLKDIIFDLIAKEHDSPKNTYCIYRTEDLPISFSDNPVAGIMEDYITKSDFRTEKSINDNRSTDRTTSFSDGLGAGLMRDYMSGSALGIMANNLNRTYSDKMLCIILPKRALLEHSIPVYIPPIIAMGSVLGEGEFHHPRIKRAQIEGERIDDLYRDDFCYFALQKIPAVYFGETFEEITGFWRTLKPVDCFKYDFFRYNETLGTYFLKTIVTETYFYDEKSDSKETDSSD